MWEGEGEVGGVWEWEGDVWEGGGGGGLQGLVQRSVAK